MTKSPMIESQGGISLTGSGRKNKPPSEIYWIGAKSQSDAEQIASEHGLKRPQWRRAHGGRPNHLKDGINVSNRNYLLGEFTSGEWLVLTAHLPDNTKPID